jgi:hypothetical protein
MLELGRMRARVLLQVLVERKRQPNQVSDRIQHLYYAVSWLQRDQKCKWSEYDGIVHCAFFSCYYYD